MIALTVLLGCAATAVAGAKTVTEKKASTTKRTQFKNLPDISMTGISEVSWQEEVNVYSYAGFANTSVDFGLPDHWNVGFAVINVNLADDGTQPFHPDGFVNIEKAIKLGENWRMIMGSQLGVRLFHDRQGRRLQAFSYIDSQIDIGEARFHLGGYHVNRTLSGISDEFGFLIGMELPLPIRNLSLIGDYISGHNSLSAATAQVLWRLGARLELGCGAIIPLPGSGTDYSGILEVNWR